MKSNIKQEIYINLIRRGLSPNEILDLLQDMILFIDSNIIIRRKRK